MAYFQDGSPAMLELESMVDKVGMRNVLYALARIAGEKANHVGENWQDRNMEREWNKAAKALDTFAAKLSTPLD